MLGDQAFELDRHIVAGEIRELRGARAPNGVERQLLQVSGFGHVHPRFARRAHNVRAQPPLSWRLRDLLLRRRYPPITQKRRVVALSSVFIPLAVRFPESFRGGCSFGAGLNSPISPAGFKCLAGDGATRTVGPLRWRGNWCGAATESIAQTACGQARTCDGATVTCFWACRASR